MPRAWLLSLFILLTALCMTPPALRAQNGDTSRPRQNNIRTRQVDPASYAVEPAYPNDARPSRQITPTKRRATGENAVPQAGVRSSSATGSLWTSFGSLALVTVVILLIARTWKKHGPRIGGGIPPEAVEVLGKRSIDQRQSLHLVRLGSRILLLGSSPGGLRTLAEVTDPVDVDSLAGLCRQSDADGTAAETFRALFNRNVPNPASRRSRSRSGELPLESRTNAPDPQRFPRPDLEETHG